MLVNVDLTAALRSDQSRMSPATSYSTLTQTVVMTSHVSVICAQLFNVSGACGSIGIRQQPIILTFDEDMDNIDDHPLFQPTETVRYLITF